MNRLDCTGDMRSEPCQADHHRKDANGWTQAGNTIVSRSFMLQLDPRHMPGQRALRRRALRAARRGCGMGAGGMEVTAHPRPTPHAAGLEATPTLDRDAAGHPLGHEECAGCKGQGTA